MVALPSTLTLFGLVLACFLGGHFVILALFSLLTRRRVAAVGGDPAGGVALKRGARSVLARSLQWASLRYLAEFVGAESLMLTAALRLGIVRLSPFDASSLPFLAIAYPWWELWFYAGHRLMHTRALYPLHRPHHGATGVHRSLCFGALETVLLSAGFYVPLAVGSRVFHAVSVTTLVLTFGIAYALNVLSHLEVDLFGARFERSRWRHAFNSTRYHSQHHRSARGNFGLNSPWFDRLFGTRLGDTHTVSREAPSSVTAATGSA